MEKYKIQYTRMKLILGQENLSWTSKNKSGDADHFWVTSWFNASLLFSTCPSMSRNICLTTNADQQDRTTSSTWHTTPSRSYLDMIFRFLHISWSLALDKYLFWFTKNSQIRHCFIEIPKHEGRKDIAIKPDHTAQLSPYISPSFIHLLYSAL